MTTLFYHYKGFGGCDSRCNLYIRTVNDIHCFCFEDVGMGTSVTNMSEHLATEMVVKYNLHPQNCRFFETYNHPGEERTFDEITYTWEGRKASNPEWKPSTEGSLFHF